MTRTAVLALFGAAALAGAAPIPPDARVRQAFGAWLDPDKDCMLEVLKGDAIRVRVPKTHHSMFPDPGKWNAPRLWQDVTGDFTVAVRVSFPIPGPGEAYAERHRRAVHAAGLIAWASDDDHVRLVRQAHTSDKVPEEQFSVYPPHLRGKGGRIETSVPLAEETRPSARLRLERRGDKVTGFYSRDGAGEEYKFGPVTVGWGQTVRVGVVAENGYEAGFEATFDEYKLTVPKK